MQCKCSTNALHGPINANKEALFVRVYMRSIFSHAVEETQTSSTCWREKPNSSQSSEPQQKPMMRETYSQWCLCLRLFCPVRQSASLLKVSTLRSNTNKQINEHCGRSRSTLRPSVSLMSLSEVSRIQREVNEWWSVPHWLTRLCYRGVRWTH